MRRSIVLHRLMVTAVLAWAAHPGAAETELKVDCGYLPDVDFPEADWPTPEEEATLAHRGSVALLHGIDMPADPVAARKCAFLELRDIGPYPWGYFGIGVLMVIYANGDGVPRNLDLAAKIACELGWSEHLERLLAMKNDVAEQSKRFEFCDGDMSTSMIVVCYDLNKKIAAVERRKRRETALAGLGQERCAAYVKVEETAAAYFEAAVGNEIDTAGSGHAAWGIEERAKLDDSLVAMFERLVSNDLPPKATSEQLAKAEVELRCVYAELMEADLSWQGGGNPTKEGLQEAQRAWPPYLDAWTSFATDLRPDLGPEAWQIMLMEERTSRLKVIAEWL